MKNRMSHGLSLLLMNNKEKTLKIRKKQVKDGKTAHE